MLLFAKNCSSFRLETIEHQNALLPTPSPYRSDLIQKRDNETKNRSATMPTPYFSEIRYLGAGSTDFIEVAVDTGTDVNASATVPAEAAPVAEAAPAAEAKAETEAPKAEAEAKTEEGGEA